MKRVGTFVMGVVTGVSVVAAAGGLRAWTRGNLEAANELFGPRSGLHFSLQDPPDPERPNRLVVRAHPVAGLTQVVRVLSNPPDPDTPPDPCFVAVLGNPPEPDRPNIVQLTIEHPEQLVLRGPGGVPAQLCAAPPIDGGGTVDQPTN